MVLLVGWWWAAAAAAAAAAGREEVNLELLEGTMPVFKTCWSKSCSTLSVTMRSTQVCLPLCSFFAAKHLIDRGPARHGTVSQLYRSHYQVAATHFLRLQVLEAAAG
jgi:hypothetical protein